MPGEKVMSTMLPAGDFFNDAEDPLSVHVFFNKLPNTTATTARDPSEYRRPPTRA